MPLSATRLLYCVAFFRKVNRCPESDTFTVYVPEYHKSVRCRTLSAIEHKDLAAAGTTKSGVSLPGILIHLRCCLDSGQMNNIKTTFGGCFAIVAGFSPTNRARQRHWTNGQIFSADHAGSMSQILACNRPCRYTVQTVITYLGTTKPRYLWCHTAWRGFFL